MAGTSLTVHPFASLTQLVPESCPRVLINMDQAGDIGSRADDVLLLGKSDEIVRQICEALGPDWVEELDAMWKETEKYASKDEVEEKKVDAAAAAETKTVQEVKDEKALVESQKLQDEVDKLTREVERSLQLGKPVVDDVPAKSEVSAAGNVSADDAKPQEEETAATEKAPVEGSTEAKVAKPEGELVGERHSEDHKVPEGKL